MAKKVAAIDFDSVIWNYQGWNKGVIDGEIIPGVREGLKKLMEMDYYILVYSTRTNPTFRKLGEPEQFSQMQEYLYKNKIPYDRIYRGEGKPMFHVTLDDRAINFNGDWKKAVEDIKNFKVWNRPDAKSSSELNDISNS